MFICHMYVFAQILNVCLKNAMAQKKTLDMHVGLFIIEGFIISKGTGGNIFIELSEVVELFGKSISVVCYSQERKKQNV